MCKVLLKISCTIAVLIACALLWSVSLGWGSGSKEPLEEQSLPGGVFISVPSHFVPTIAQEHLSVFEGPREQEIIALHFNLDVPVSSDTIDRFTVDRLLTNTAARVDAPYREGFGLLLDRGRESSMVFGYMRGDCEGIGRDMATGLRLLVVRFYSCSNFDRDLATSVIESVRWMEYSERPP